MILSQLPAERGRISNPHMPLEQRRKQLPKTTSMLDRGFFPKIIVRHDIRKRWYDDNGILNIGVIDFLLDDSMI